MSSLFAQTSRWLLLRSSSHKALSSPRHVSTSVHVQGLPSTTTEHDVFQLFHPYGTIREMVLTHSRSSPSMDDSRSSWKMKRDWHLRRREDRTAILTFDDVDSAIMVVEGMHSRPLPPDWPESYRDHERDGDERSQQSESGAIEDGDDYEMNDEHESRTSFDSQSLEAFDRALLTVQFESSSDGENLLGWVKRDRVLSRGRMELYHEREVLRRELRRAIDRAVALNEEEESNVDGEVEGLGIAVKGDSLPSFTSTDRRTETEDNLQELGSSIPETEELSCRQYEATAEGIEELKHRISSLSEQILAPPSPRDLIAANSVAAAWAAEKKRQSSAGQEKHLSRNMEKGRAPSWKRGGGEEGFGGNV